MNYRYNSLEDFLATNPLSVDALLDDGWGAKFPVKGREIEAAILFSDITGFSRRTLNLSPTETLIFVNNFFAWISAEALKGRPGIVDKYIGDEVMIVFSKEFGSDDPFVDAVQTARWMIEYDVLAFVPHVGIASGPVTVGYVGTPLKYNCSVFGAAVAMAARCASVKPEAPDEEWSPSSIIFPAAEWGDRSLEVVVPRQKYAGPDGSTEERPYSWELGPVRAVPMKNLPDTEVREIRKRSFWIPLGHSIEDRVRGALQSIREAGRYWPSHDVNPKT